MPDVTYDMCEGWGFPIGREAFEASMPVAEALVSRIVGPNEVSGQEAEEAWGKAVCAASVCIDANGTDAVCGFKIGSLSVSATQAGTDGRSLAREAAMDFLVPAGLAWAGVCR